MNDTTSDDPQTEAHDVDDPQADGEATDANDPFNLAALMNEAMQAIGAEVTAVQNEAHSVEDLAALYQSHVQQYTDAFANTWQSSMQVYQAEIDKWQDEVTKAQASLPQFTAAPAPAPAASGVTQEHLQALKERLSGVVRQKTEHTQQRADAAKRKVAAKQKPAANSTPPSPTSKS